jgi:hypothetical protein
MGTQNFAVVFLFIIKISSDYISVMITCKYPDMCILDRLPARYRYVNLSLYSNFFSTGTAYRIVNTNMVIPVYIYLK